MGEGNKKEGEGRGDFWRRERTASRSHVAFRKVIWGDPYWYPIVEPIFCSARIGIQ